MNTTDLAFSSALTQAKLLRQGEITPLDLVQLYLDRIRALDGTISAFVTVMAEQALADARRQTDVLEQSKSGDPLPPLFGIPITIKDLNAVAGVPCALGVSALRSRVVESDDGVVNRIRQSGLIILGKTTVSQLGSMPFTEPPGFAPTRNPWQLDTTPGGSSGGAAAALAAGLSPLAQGSDAGGSIRGPAFCCGLVGIKPSRGRVSFAPVGDVLNGLASIGPLARTVADAAALLDVMSGYTTGDPYWLPAPQPTFQTIATQGFPASRKLRIAVTSGLPDIGPSDSDCCQAVQDTADRLATMGHELVAACPPVADLVEPFSLIWRTSVAMSGLPVELLSPMNQWLQAGSPSSQAYLQAITQIQVISRRIVQFFDDFDVLLLPTYLHSPIRIGEWADCSPEATFQQVINWVAPCPPFNATGQPAIAIPVGFSPQGVPIGVQLVGRPADEATIIALAADLEAVAPWAHHRPHLVECS